MFGVTLRAAGPAEACWRLVDGAAAFEAASSVRALGYAPHLTLIRGEGLNPGRLVAVVEAMAEDEPLSLVFDRVRRFETDPLVLWLAPRPDPRLADFHRRLHGRLAGEVGDPHYAPGSWRPHLTLAMAVARERREDAVAFSDRKIDPVDLVFDWVDVLTWPPVTHLAATRLGQRAGGLGNGGVRGE